MESFFISPFNFISPIGCGHLTLSDVLGVTVFEGFVTR
jgi:hypothetical protein